MRREALKFIISVSKGTAAKAEAKVSHAQPAEGHEYECCYTTVQSAMQERRTITLLHCKHNTRTFNNTPPPHIKKYYSANVKCRQCRICLYTYIAVILAFDCPYCYYCYLLLREQAHSLRSCCDNYKRATFWQTTPYALLAVLLV